MNQTILENCLRAIQDDRLQGGYDRSLTGVSRLLDAEGQEQLAERLDAAIPQTWPWDDVATLFTILLWWTDYNGAAVMRTIEGWLREGMNVRRIQIALHLNRYPFHDPDEMERVLSGIAQRFPEVADRCAELMTERTRLKE
jgi:hypothetical protein